MAWVAVSATSAVGHDPVVRIYIPILALLLVAPLVERYSTPNAKRVARWRVYAITAVTAFAGYTAVTNAEQRRENIHNREHERALSMQLIDAEYNKPHAPTLVVWGDSIALASLYPMLQRRDDIPQVKLHRLGVTTMAPNSVAFDERSHGRDVISQMRSPDGAHFVIPVEGGWTNELSPSSRLGTMCAERFDGALSSSVEFTANTLQVMQVRCVSQNSEDAPNDGAPSTSA
jgi:hypothetical protein